MTRPRPGVVLLGLATAIAALWLVLHAAGWRECTRIFSFDGTATVSELVKALAYAAVHLLLVFVMPIFALAGLGLAVYARGGDS